MILKIKNRPTIQAADELRPILIRVDVSLKNYSAKIKHKRIHDHFMQ